MTIVNMDNYNGEALDLINRWDDSLDTEAGTGVTTGTGTIYQASVIRHNDTIETRILLDLTGLDSVATDLDIIGVSGTALPCHLGQITAATNGTIFGGTVKCLEVPTGGDPNVAFYSANEGTGVEDDGIAALTETLICDPAADWTLGLEVGCTNVVPADDYLYVVQGDATGTAATYTAGKFLIQLFGYTS